MGDDGVPGFPITPRAENYPRPQSLPGRQKGARLLLPVLLKPLALRTRCRGGAGTRRAASRAAYWRQLLARVARDLERLAGNEVDGRRSRVFAVRAMRIRQRLHDGMPEDYAPATGHRRMTSRR
jgi:hypothetical protein